VKFTHRLINAWSELPASPRGSDAARSPFGERRGTRVECGACGGPLQHGRSTSMTRRVRRYVGLTKNARRPGSRCRIARSTSKSQCAGATEQSWTTPS